MVPGRSDGRGETEARGSSRRRDHAARLRDLRVWRRAAAVSPPASIAAPAREVIRLTRAAMKCPACKATHRRKDGPKCSKCGHRFVFFDRTEGITDHAFVRLLERASVGGTQYFTLNQLTTVWAQKVAKETGSTRMVFGAIATVGACIAAFSSPPSLVLAALMGSAGLSVGTWGVVRRFKPSEPPIEWVPQWVRKWTKAGHTIPALLTEPSLHHAPPEFRESDIYDYGVERILIVQHDLLVDLFVRNGLHIKERALVISEHGYPQYLVPHAQALLQRSPELPVFLLHDADPIGLMMRVRLWRSELFPLEGHPVIDTGLSPREVGRIGKLEALAPERRGNALPADALPYALLASGFALSFTERLPLADLVERKDPDGSSSFG